MSPLTEDQLEARFWDLVRPTGFCWEWTGPRTWNGYGEFTANCRRQRAHRVSYETLIGPIPKGLVLDHLCRNKLCVNPDHLDPVTIGENVRRGFEIRSTNECPQGHEMTPDNVYMDAGLRKCRTCVLARMRRYYAKKVSA
jgi:hypothetical protein